MEATEELCTGVVDGAMFVTESGATITLARVRVPRVGIAGGAVLRMLVQRRIQGRRLKIEARGRDAFGNLLAEVWVGGENVSDYVLQEMKERAYSHG